ncbi:MAG TPA: CAP domain-containing protein [Flavisolibacter sp.]|jgi:uncharacterized protein YkwD|nr:CAP domain-containing protein [Flavisolibacter sp.]
MIKAFLLFILISLTFQPATGIDKEEAQKAFLLLNSIRTNPQSFTTGMEFLKDVKAMPQLKWNDTLAKVAEAKALDMATRNYFGHVDPDGYGMNYFINKAGYKLEAAWISSKELNYFESLGAGAKSGEAAIRSLIIDANTPSLGHRKHLLGIDRWNAPMTDIGIGFARPSVAGSSYKTYVCILIARHRW